MSIAKRQGIPLGLLLLLLTAAPLAAQDNAQAKSGAAVRDTAGMFGPDAVRDAEARLRAVQETTGIPVVIETVDSLNGEPIGEVGLRLARQSGSEGIFLLLSKKDRAISAPLFRRQLASRLPEPKRIAIRDAFIAEFKKGDYDAGLRQGVAAIAEALGAEARPDVPAGIAGAAVEPGADLVLRGRIDLTLAGAQTILAAAEAKARQMNLKMNIAVVDDGGHPIAFARMDGARPASAYTAQTKAVTAATFRAPSGPLPAGTDNPDPLLNLSLQNAAAASGGKITTLHGGVPITVDGQIIGAVGCGGGTGEQDAEVARAGIQALLDALRPATEAHNKDD